MSTDIKQDAQKLQEEIFEQDYYIHLYLAALAQHGMTKEGISQGEFDENTIVNMANSFWFALPDSMAIRRQPFYRLCDIAEHCFDGPEEE
jgi:hypothetical protein